MIGFRKFSHSIKIILVWKTHIS